MWGDQLHRPVLRQVLAGHRHRRADAGGLTPWDVRRQLGLAKCKRIEEIPFLAPSWYSTVLYWTACRRHDWFVDRG